jgi:hypothetical protein
MDMDESNDEELEQRLAQTEVPEIRYKADMALHDRSQKFSVELLRLALAGIAVVGFLLANIPEAHLTLALRDPILKFLLSASVVAFAVSVGCALLQRFYASAAMFHHMKVMKLLWIGDLILVKKDLRTRASRFTIAHLCLKLAAAFLLLGAAFLGSGFIRLMTAAW